jgi:hypothetical protein
MATAVRQNLLKDGAPAASAEVATNALRLTDAMRWLERTAQHVWRISHYLTLGRSKKPSQAPVSGTEPKI